MIGVKSHLQIIVDESVWGTTQQKRDVAKLDYDQFIYVDPDISIHEQQLKLQLMAAQQISEESDLFVLSPNIPRWWDVSWDVLVHQSRRNNELGEITAMNGLIFIILKNILINNKVFLTIVLLVICVALRMSL